MCKSIKKQFFSKLTYSKLLEAHDRAKQGKTNKKELILFEMDLETNIMNLYRNLKTGKYKMGKYREFTIYEPKERIIKALPYVDRIVHQWYIEEFIKPFIIPKFITSSFACLDNRGTHTAVQTLQRYMRLIKRKYHNYYVLKCDIKKYFYTIDKNILFNIMKSYISDKYLLELTKLFIFDNDEKVGIPIGNYTSQFFANIYLDKLDHLIKDNLKVKYYVRYMDDFILLLKDKKEAKLILNQIALFLNEKLHLELNKKTRYYPNKQGIDFCGYKIFETHIKIRKRSIKKIKRKIKLWNKLYAKNKLDFHNFLLCFNSFKGHIKHANCYNLYNKLISSIEFEIPNNEMQFYQ